MQILVAEILPNGQIHFLENFSLDRKVKAYVTILAEEVKKKMSTDWHQLVGALKNAPVFEGDSVEMQRAMRDEWA